MSSEIDERVERIASKLNLSEEEKKYVTTANNVEEFIVENKGEKYKGYRVQHNDDLGPYKGGMRYHPNVTKEEVKNLAFWMALKTSLVNIPLGGGKGGLAINPKDLSEEEYEDVTRQMARALKDVVGEDKDIPAPDVYTNEKVMAWFLDEFEKEKARKEPGVITGKPLLLGGSKGRSIATSQGGVYILEEIYKEKKPSVIIEGFGNAGMNMALTLQGRGYKIIGVSDSSTGLYNEEGLNVEEIALFKKKGSKLSEFEDEEKISGKELLSKKSDVLIPAAMEGSIDEEVAKSINAEYVLELANGPVTPAGDKVLAGKDILVIPDILANAGGVIVSYYEWIQNKTGEYWSEEYVLEKLKEKIVNAYEDVLEESKNIGMREAAYSLAIKRILEAAKLRGRI